MPTHRWRWRPTWYRSKAFIDLVERSRVRLAVVTGRDYNPTRPFLHRGKTRKVDKLATIRFGSARYSLPKEARRRRRQRAPPPRLAPVGIC